MIPGSVTVTIRERVESSTTVDAMNAEGARSVESRVLHRPHARLKEEVAVRAESVVIPWPVNKEAVLDRGEPGNQEQPRGKLSIVATMIP